MPQGNDRQTPGEFAELCATLTENDLRNTLSQMDRVEEELREQQAKAAEFRPIVQMELLRRERAADLRPTPVEAEDVKAKPVLEIEKNKEGDKGV